MTQRGTQPPFKATGQAHSVDMLAAVAPIGSVPYDNASLALISPDGQLVATQTGAPPHITTELARPNGGIASATSIEVYQLNYDEKPAVLRHHVGNGLLLGRSYDRQGFLVEAPQPDGSRWVGKVSWTTGDVHWLVQDTNVNAFACLGPGGRLAWSRRAIDEEHFSLVVREGSSEWTVPPNGDDWLMPQWSGRGAGLFLMILKDGDIDAGHAIASNAAALRQTMRRIPLSRNATSNSAFQAMAAQCVQADAEPPMLESLIFFHPGHACAAIWRPMLTGSSPLFLFGQKSATATQSSTDFVMLSTPDNLVHQHVRQGNVNINLLRGFLVPRPTPDGPWDHVLLAPQDSYIGLTALRLIRRGQVAAQ